MLFRYICRGVKPRCLGPKSKSNISKAAILAAVCAVVLLILFFVVTARLRPMIEKMADSSITDLVTVTVNDVINEKIHDGSLDYSKLVDLEKDADGKITALVTNMAKINALQTEITNEVIEHLSDEEYTVIRIPLGSVTGSAVLAGVGPNIPVRILSVSSVLSDFDNAFTSAGINQTCHKIVLNVDVVLDIVMPGSTISTTVSTQVNVAETIIVGGVPSAYADLQ